MPNNLIYDGCFFALFYYHIRCIHEWQGVKCNNYGNIIFLLSAKQHSLSLISTKTTVVFYGYSVHDYHM